MTGAPRHVDGVEVPTRDGPASARIEGAAAPEGAVPSFLLALTHGAGGLPDAPDLLAVRDAALTLHGTVAMITQAYRIRGARSPGSAARQDAAWTDVIAWLRGEFRGIPLIQGGRSNGARLACRTACTVGASAVIALAFPLHPPGRSRQQRPADAARRSRAAELRAARGAGAGVLVVNGDRDPFGVPCPDDAARVVVLAGESHSLSKNPAAVSEAVTAWLRDILPLAG